MSFEQLAADMPDEIKESAGDSAETIVRVKNLSKAYIAATKPGERLWEVLTGRSRSLANVPFALDDVSFELRRGDRLGIVGENGSGKSTLLKILCNVLGPSSGSAEVNGRVSALLELGAGFNPDLTGIENILQYCRLHGLSASQAEASVESISIFSELGATLDSPLRTYSSGEGVRLGFSCAVHVKPDVLIVDEALSVGDAYFQIKCMNKIQSMLDDGVTFIYVTHAADGVRALCNKGVWLDHGKIRQIGSSKTVSEAYEAEMFRRVAAAGLKRSFHADELHDDETFSDELENTADLINPIRAKLFIDRVKAFRTGTGEVRIDDVILIDDGGSEAAQVDYESDLRIRVYFTYVREVTAPVDIGVGITDVRGGEIVHHSLATHGCDARTIGVGKSGYIDLHSKNVLCPGEFGINVGANTLVDHPTLTSQKIANDVIDYCIGAANFSVKQPKERGKLNSWGVVRSEFTVEIKSF